MKKPPMIVRVMNSILIFGFVLILTMGAIYLWITEPDVAGRCISLFFLLLSVSLTTLGISIAKGEVR